MYQRLEQTAALDKPVSTLRFASGKRLEHLHKQGIYTVRDLLAYYPFRYNDFTDITSIRDAKIGERVSVLGTIDSVAVRRTKRGYNLVEIAIIDGTGVLKAVWFNQPWLEKLLKRGGRILLLGKLEHSYGYKNLASPLYTLIDAGQESDSPEQDEVAAAGIQPVYHASAELSSNWIKRLVTEALAVVDEPLDPLPASLRVKRRLTSRQTALKQIHFPNTMQQLELAHQRLAYEEILILQLRMALQVRRQGQTSIYAHAIAGELMDSFNANLPFTLTASQQNAVAEILSNMSAPERMNRMLLGDVGSGKTIVATYALIAAAQNHWQAAVMAPTEVLAKQYANSIGGLLDKVGVSWVLISSNTSAVDRQTALEGLKSGVISIAFGTHALIEPDVCFKNLSLVVIDEQQRFGVEQRQRLTAKDPNSDFLSMTATPIPRSLALVIYGDITTSYLDSRPMPAKISTRLLDNSLVYQAYEQVRKALEQGHQAYIVCPLITASGQKTTEGKAGSKVQTREFDQEEPEQLIDDLFDYSDADNIKAAEQEVQYLRNVVFPNNNVALLTSKLPSAEKQLVMQDFRDGKIDVLVSTTVIEVGVDVPNATVMIIQDADRFGLSQLHQLRGRVGRGQRDSQVYLVTRSQKDVALDRLRLLEQESDGLRLAEHDLLMRREGDIAGVRQSGETALALINVIRDAELINQAHQDCQTILATDPNLDSPELTHLKYELQATQQGSNSASDSR